MFLTINAKPWSIVDHAQCWGAGHYPRTGVSGGRGGGEMVPISDFVRLAGVCIYRVILICS